MFPVPFTSVCKYRWLCALFYKGVKIVKKFKLSLPFLIVLLCITTVMLAGFIYHFEPIMLLADYHCGEIRFQLLEVPRQEAVEKKAAERFDEAWIIGKTKQEVQERYGIFDVHSRTGPYNSVGDGWEIESYKHSGNVSYESTCWGFVIFFEDGIAEKTEVQYACKIMGG